MGECNHTTKETSLSNRSKRPKLVRTRNAATDHTNHDRNDRTERNQHQPQPVQREIRIEAKNPTQKQYLRILNDPKNRICFAIGPAGTGKAQPLDAKIKTPNGWVTMGDVRIGDTISAPDGSETTVSSIHPQGEKEIFAVTFADGRSTECCKEHLWRVSHGGSWSVRSLESILSLPSLSDASIQLLTPPVSNDVTLPIEPYRLGTLLCDNYNTFVPDIQDELAQIGAIGRLPDVYKGSSTRQKEMLLKGLVVGSGLLGNESGNVTMTFIDEQLASDIVELVRSMGGIARMDGAIGLHSVHIEHGHQSFLPSDCKDLTLGFKSIISVGTKEAQCISVDHSDHLYVTDDYIVTHNTMLAVLRAISALKRQEIKKMVITRPAVGVGKEDHGFLPGTLNEKMEPWLLPILDLLAENYTQVEIKDMFENKIIEIAPLMYMRGRTFKDCHIILDEAQNTTEESMKLILTRLGTNSRIFITGDTKQRDSKYTKSGLVDFIERLQSYESEAIAVVEFGHGDIERDYIVSQVLEIYGDEDEF